MSNIMHPDISKLKDHQIAAECEYLSTVHIPNLISTIRMATGMGPFSKNRTSVPVWKTCEDLRLASDRLAALADEYYARLPF
jgi:hypothetical protein